MAEDYFRNKNISNTLDNQNYFILQEKNPFRNSNNLTNYSSRDGSKTIENTDESLGIEEIPPKEEDIDYLQQYNIEKGNTRLQFNNKRRNSLNANKIPHFSFINPFQNGKNFFKSGKIPHPRKTEGIIPLDRNKYGIGLVNKRKGIMEKLPSKQIQSRYSSLSENKYHFMHRLDTNNKLELDNFGDNDNYKENYGPVDSIRKSKNINNIRHMNNSGKKIYTYRNSNNGITSGISSNSDTNLISIENHSYYRPTNNIPNKNLYKKENRPLNNKITSNYDYNTIDVNDLQNHIQLAKTNQHKNYPIQNKNMNKLISNYNLSTENIKIDYFPTKSGVNNINTLNYQNILKNNNNYKISNDINIENKRLTVGYKYNNESQNMANYNEALNQNEDTNEPEIATVTKLSSSDDNNNLDYNPLSNKDMDKDSQFQNNIDIENDYISPENKSHIINKSDSKNYFAEEEIKNILGINTEPYLNQQSKTYIYPSSSMIPQKTNLKYASNLRPIKNNHNFYTLNIDEFFDQNLQNNYIPYNNLDSQRENIIDDQTVIIPSINKVILNNNDKIIYPSNNYNENENIGLVKKFDGVSRPGRDSLGFTKTNQDAYICKSNINNINDFNIFGVLDGHGPDGHFVSEFISEFIPSQIINHKDIINLSNPEEIYKKLKENSSKIITQAFIKADKQLKSMEFDISESGCTCCLIIHIGKHIICANTGDSRAILVYDQTNEINSKNLDYLGIVPLSIDYKPELPEEASRIIFAGGSIEQMKNEYGVAAGPYRVWVRGKDYPGLAMSRSIGDLKAKTIGVIPDPGIMEYDLNKSTKYIIACSDGVWEFLNNENVMNMGKKFYLENNPHLFCQELVSKAYSAWEKNETIVDDITAVVAFF